MMRDARLYLGEDPLECAMEMDEPEDEEEVENILREMSDDELAYLFAAIICEIQRRLNEEESAPVESCDLEDPDDEDEWDLDEWEDEDEDEWEDEDEDDYDGYKPGNWAP